MKDSARHTCIMIGIALVILSVIMAYMTLGGERELVSPESSTVPHSEYNEYSLPSTTVVATNSVNSLINLNTATVEELETIDGVGEKTALQIISYRNELGGYTSVSQLMDIKGIGEAKYSMIAPFVTL